MLAARLNLGSTEPSIFANGWTIFFGAYFVTTSTESVLPSASLKTNRLADVTIWPWAAVAENKPQMEITIRYEARGVFFGMESAVYRAGSLPAQPVLAHFSTFFPRVR